MAAAYAGVGEFEHAGRTGLEAVGLLRSAPSARSLDVLRQLSHQVGSIRGDAVAEFKSALVGIA
jgi:hypothetical protein